MPGMAVGLLIATVLAAPPLPGGEPPVKKPDRLLANEAEAFGRQLIDLADRVSLEYVKPIQTHELLLAGLTELYDAVGQKLPDEVRKKVLNGTSYSDYLRTLTDTRVSLGRRDELNGWRAFVIAANGFSRATDPYCALTWQRTTSAATSDAEFGMGFELEGATGGRWIAYVLDSGSMGQIMNPERPLPVEPPVGPRWVVKRVIPGSPAASAGMRPGDRITQLNGVAVTANSNAATFRRLTSYSIPDLRDEAPIDASKPIRLQVERPGSPKPLDVELSRAGYSPDSVFGVFRRVDGSWDYMLDREAKVGYIRLGSVETPAAEAFGRAVTSLVQDGAAGLVLDLRWCPGGFVDPTARICGVLLPEGATIGTVKYRHPDRNYQTDYFASAGQGATANLTLPIAVLIGCDTTGGGEMIAAAFQDHKRAIVVGQRTFGKANLMNIVNTPIPGLAYRVSTGYSFRPSGKARHRFPNSKPTDDWGVRPDRGYEAPSTPDFSARMRLLAEQQAIRPAGNLDSVDFDDPLADPQKLLAVKFLKDVIAK